MDNGSDTQTTVNDSATCAGLRAPVTQGRSLSDLIDSYQTDPVSSYHRLRYATRRNHGNLLARLRAQHGHRLLSDIRARVIKEMHQGWSEGGKVAVGHAFIASLRTICGYGATDLEEAECERLCLVLHKLRFPSSPPRTTFLTADQADAIRAVAHDMGWPSIALAQAFQFECMLRQKDVIGEWIPFDEPGESDVRFRGMKWLRGIRWNEISGDLVLTHMTSKRQKELEIDLRNSPMVMAELPHVIHRTADGPIIINEITAMPWSASEFRRKWRICADLAGVPKTVRSMDSRAGAITEATEAGANIEHVKHAATHSDIAQTQHYARGAAAKIATVQSARNLHRGAQYRNKFRNNS